jgi:hypothetical protein
MKANIYRACHRAARNVVELPNRFRSERPLKASPPEIQPMVPSCHIPEIALCGPIWVTLLLFRVLAEFKAHLGFRRRNRASKVPLGILIRTYTNGGTGLLVRPAWPWLATPPGVAAGLLECQLDAATTCRGCMHSSRVYKITRST